MCVACESGCTATPLAVAPEYLECKCGISINVILYVVLGICAVIATVGIYASYFMWKKKKAAKMATNTASSAVTAAEV